METTTNNATTAADPYPAPSSKTLAEILRDLRKPIPAKKIKKKKVPIKKGGFYEADYVHHTTIRDLLDYYAPGWETTVHVQGIAGKIYITVRLMITGSDGLSIAREGVGNEDDAMEGYGDPSSNAHAMALRRAAMEFGLGRDLWRK